MVRDGIQVLGSRDLLGGLDRPPGPGIGRPRGSRPRVRQRLPRVLQVALVAQRPERHAADPAVRRQPHLGRQRVAVLAPRLPRRRGIEVPGRRGRHVPAPAPPAAALGAPREPQRRARPGGDPGHPVVDDRPVVAVQRQPQHEAAPVRDAAPPVVVVQRPRQRVAAPAFRRRQRRDRPRRPARVVVLVAHDHQRVGRQRQFVVVVGPPPVDGRRRHGHVRPAAQGRVQRSLQRPHERDEVRLARRPQALEVDVDPVAAARDDPVDDPPDQAGTRIRVRQHRVHHGGVEADQGQHDPDARVTRRPQQGFQRGGAPVPCLAQAPVRDDLDPEVGDVRQPIQAHRRVVQRPVRQPAQHHAGPGGGRPAPGNPQVRRRGGGFPPMRLPRGGQRREGPGPRRRARGSRDGRDDGPRRERQERQERQEHQERQERPSSLVHRAPGRTCRRCARRPAPARHRAASSSAHRSRHRSPSHDAPPRTPPAPLSIRTADPFHPGGHSSRAIARRTFARATPRGRGTPPGRRSAMPRPPAFAGMRRSW